jgi:hypothetical protein
LGAKIIDSANIIRKYRKPCMDGRLFNIFYTTKKSIFIGIA